MVTAPWGAILNRFGARNRLVKSVWRYDHYLRRYTVVFSFYVIAPASIVGSGSNLVT